MVAVSREEKWEPTILRVICLYLGLQSSYLAERKRNNGVTLLPYWGLLRLLHHPLKVLYLLVWSQGRVFSSREQDSRLADGTTRVTSMLVRPSAKSSILTLIRFPATCLLSLVRPGGRVWSGGAWRRGRGL